MLDYKTFEHYVNKVVALHEFIDQLDTIGLKYARATDSDVELFFPTLELETIELLQKLMNDKDEWLGYWVYETDCGKRCKTGELGVTDDDGKDIPLVTVRDLYNLLASTAVKEPLKEVEKREEKPPDKKPQNKEPKKKGPANNIELPDAHVENVSVDVDWLIEELRKRGVQVLCNGVEIEGVDMTDEDYLEAMPDDGKHITININ